MSVPGPPPVPCLVGPTAAGKSGVALALARRLDAEVIACDAFGVYRGMEVLAAAPNAPPDVPHHLVGFLEPTEAYSAARFVDDADRLVAGIRARGRTPLVVGGTALYLRAWLFGFGAPVPRDEAFRQRLRAEAEAAGARALHERLRRVDPERAAALHPHDTRRVIRALEIHRKTGTAPSRLRGQWAGPPRIDARVVCLRRQREDLAERIARRTQAMFESGVVAEVQALLARSLAPEARKVLGLDVLQALLEGAIDRPEAEALIAQKTRRLARKQMTFFRGFAGMSFVDVEADAAVAETVAAALGPPYDA